MGIGETWRRGLAKCVLLVGGCDAKESCGIDQLCAGLEAGIEGGIHAVEHMWDVHHQEEEWGFLLIDARNAFNEGNRTVMLWTVRHEWPAGARFSFNCYKHWSILVIRGNRGSGVKLFSKEGVTQGDPLAMFCYGLGLLPLIRQLKDEFHDVEQIWYADDAGAGGKFARLRRQYLRLEELGPNYGYFPESLKSILVTSSKNVEAAKEVFADLKFQVKTGNRYLGGFIGEPAARDEWIQEKTTDWAQAVKELASVASSYPQSAYAGMQKSLQNEWQFVQRVRSKIAEKFEPVKDALNTHFIPALFSKPIDDDDP